MIYRFKENRVRRAYTGGSRIDSLEGKGSISDSRYPEEWIASTSEAFNPDMPVKGEGLSVLPDGRSFRELVASDPVSILGASCYARYGAKLPILVKLLDSAERLAVQCHPTVKFAQERMNAPFGKTECWYIIDASEGAHVYLGFKEGITRREYVEYFEKQDIEAMLRAMHRFEAKRGDFFFVGGGVPHAIGPGCLLAELQEPSDLMVIPERVTPSGVLLSELKLHCGLGFDGMFDCFDFNGLCREETQKRFVRHFGRQYGVCDVVGSELTSSFSMKHFLFKAGQYAVPLCSFAVGLIIDGSVSVADADSECSIRRGESFFIPAKSGGFLLICEKEAEGLLFLPPTI